MFQKKLLNWYLDHKRDLPWRKSQDFYAVWVSEIMLQQTQVKTVIPYWHRWMQVFPTYQVLAQASDQEILTLWQGLGYYKRCRQLHKGAQWIVEHGIPDNIKEWIKIPGVGPYTAGAICSIALNQPVPLVDGNVERVFSRFTGCFSEKHILHKEAWIWAKENIHLSQPGHWNQALMELGSTVCTSKNPLCSACPIKNECIAFQKRWVDQLPISSLKKEVKKLEFYTYIPFYNDRFGLQQIPLGEWWEGMWTFPKALYTLEDEKKLRILIGKGWNIELGKIKHVVTNHKITLHLFLVHCNTPSIHLKWFSRKELIDLPLPAPQRKALEKALPFCV